MKSKGYWVFAFVVFFVQVFILNNLTMLSPLVAPMVYIIALLMLPIEYSQWKMLLAGVVIGVIMDLTMATPGLNTFVTLPIAIARRPLLFTLGGLSSMSNEEGIPSIKRLGVNFHRYIIVMVVLHSVLFYFMERLSFVNFGTLTLRMLCSTLVSLVLDYAIIMLFIKRL